jgi:hypothetical protein
MWFTGHSLSTIHVEGLPPVTIGPGERAFGPMGVRHYFRNTGEGPGRMLAIITPGGGERYFRELEQARANPGPNLLEREEDIDRRYGMIINRRV